MEEMILILDFGSQYTQLIARRIRELNVYCEIHPYNKIPDSTHSIKGVILSGSPSSVRDDNHPVPDLSGLRKHYPVLGICYGAQFMALESGGDVEASAIREYGRANLSFIDHHNPLTAGMTPGCQVWMSHGDTIRKLLLHNFVVNICGCHQSWTPGSYIHTTVEYLKETLGNDRVVLGLSGGVDSSVAALLLHRAIGKNLHCIFVDNGLLRKYEFESVLDSYKSLGLNVKGVDAKEQFYAALKGVSDPELKRKAMEKNWACLQIFFTAIRFRVPDWE